MLSFGSNKITIDIVILLLLITINTSDMLFT